jgi:hypothetical protein
MPLPYTGMIYDLLFFCVLAAAAAYQLSILGMHRLFIDKA